MSFHDGKKIKPTSISNEDVLKAETNAACIQVAKELIMQVYEMDKSWDEILLFWEGTGLYNVGFTFSISNVSFSWEYKQQE